MTVIEAPDRTLVQAEAVIDLEALRHNVRLLIEAVAPSEFLLAIKADAYGHGDIEVARAGVEAGASALGVLEIPAGLILRDAGIDAPMFAWLHGTETDFRAGIEADIELGISAIWQLEAIARSGASKPAVIHLKIDTGLSRNGATLREWPALVDAALEAEKNGTVRIRGVWSHLADASPEDNTNALALFETAIAQAESRGARFEVRHIASSAAALRMPEARYDMVRIGIAAFGLTPFDDGIGADFGLRPVMSLRAPVIDVIDSNGRQDKQRLARVAIGFADGILPDVAGRASVVLAGERRTVTRVEVDSLLVDIGDADVRIGDTAAIFGPGAATEDLGAATALILTAEEWGTWSDTVGDEVVTHLSQRVPGYYINRTPSIPSGH